MKQKRRRNVIRQVCQRHVAGALPVNNSVKSYFSASLSTIVKRSGCGTRPGKPAAKSRSNSTTVKASHSPIKGEVNAAKPGPISQYYRLDVGSLSGQFWQSRVDHAKKF